MEYRSIQFISFSTNDDVCISSWFSSRATYCIVNRTMGVWRRQVETATSVSADTVLPRHSEPIFNVTTLVVGKTTDVELN